MLILSRNKGEKININQDIVVTILEVTGDQVRIGIEAPPQVSIYREEIYEAIQQQNKEAAVVTGQVQDLLKNVSPPDKKKRYKKMKK